MRKYAFLVTAVCMAVLLLCLSGSESFAESNEPLFRIENGMAQPVLTYTDAQCLEYTNESSDILRFVVYVETDYDTDLDGKPDLIKTMVQMPRAAAEGKCRVPVIYEARPYIAGTYGYTPVFPAVGQAHPEKSRFCTQPGKRMVSGDLSVLDLAARADPADWFYMLETDPFAQQFMGNLTAYDDLLVCGFAVVQAAGLGTWGSEGIECCTGMLEKEAFRCVVEWLTGDRNAFSDRENCMRVRADWCSGRIGMTGRSYAGAMAFEVASTGVKGLETVVPVAGVSSWYEYGNSQGATSGILATHDFIADLAAMCASRFMTDLTAVSPEEAELEKNYRDCLAYLRDMQISLAGDYGDFWEEREYSTQSGFRASALIVQGLNDETVRPKQFDLMRTAFLNAGCEVKCLLHQNGHVTPANEQTKTDLLIMQHTYTEWINLWFTHTLLGIDNEAAELPALTVQSNLDGRFYGVSEWKTGDAMEMRPQDNEEHIVSAENAHMNNDWLLRETLDGATGPDHLLWSQEIDQEITLSGPAEVHLCVRTSDTDRSLLMLGAVLVDGADEPFPCFDAGPIGVLEQNVIRKGGVSRGGAEPYDLVEWVQTEAQRKIISYGTMDLRNPDAGYLPASAVRRAEPIQPGTWYEYTLYLQPTVYTVPAGHHLELYIVPFCGFSNDMAMYDTCSYQELCDMGFDPDTLVPLTRDYRFTVDNRASHAIIPVIR